MYGHRGNLLYMNKTTTGADLAAFAGVTPADIEAFVSLVRPTFNLVVEAGSEPAIALDVAMYHGKRANLDEYSRRMVHADQLTEVLMGTYDEFRAEAKGVA